MTNRNSSKVIAAIAALRRTMGPTTASQMLEHVNAETDAAMDRPKAMKRETAMAGSNSNIITKASRNARHPSMSTMMPAAIVAARLAVMGGR